MVYQLKGSIPFIPSAGAALALGRAPERIAITGELTLTGDILAIGGEREKLLAAKRLGISEVILPAANKVDVAELPLSVCEGLTLHYAGHYKDVAKLMFGIRMKQTAPKPG